ncbi:MAG: glycosyltransferase [Acidimicrobiales bacterium]|nr:glycosyltransferase [Acidimicrobiales bacterium]
MAGDKPLRVLYMLPDFGVGGGQVILLRTVVAAQAQAGEHVVVGLRSGPMQEQYAAAGIDTLVLGSETLTDAPAAVRRLARFIRERRIDVIVSLNTPEDRTFAQLAGTLTRVPVAIWFMSVAIPLISFPPPRGRELAFLKRLALFGPNVMSVRRTHALMSLSDSVSESFAAHLRLGVDRFALVPPGLPDSFYEPPLDATALDALRESLNLERGVGPVLLNVGMLIDLKGQQELVPAMVDVVAAMPGATLLLVGEGENRPLLERTITELGLGGHVRLLGHRQDVAALLQLADGLVSASRSEGFGMAVLEAMAARKAVVAVHTPAFDEFATDGRSAVFVERQDRALLAKAIVETFGDPVRVAALGDAARADAERFRADRTASLLLDVLHRAAGRTR